MKTSAAEGGRCSPRPLESGDEGRRHGVLPSSRVTGEGNTRERQGEEQSGRAGPVRAGQSEGATQDAQHRRLKTQGPRRVAPAGGSSRAPGASCNLSSDGLRRAAPNCPPCCSRASCQRQSRKWQTDPGHGDISARQLA